MVACFPQASRSLPSATAAYLETPCVCAEQESSPKRQERCPKSPRINGCWQLVLPSKPSITFWNSLWRDCQMNCRDSYLDSNLNCAAGLMSCKGFNSLQNHSIKCVEFQVFLESPLLSPMTLRDEHSKVSESATQT